MAKKKIESEILIPDAKEPEVVEVQSNNFDKVKTLVGNLNKHYKSDVIRSGSDIPSIRKVQWGEPMLDYVNDGGCAMSRVHEMLGAEHSGKTRNSLKMLAKFQTYCFGCNTQDSLTVVWKKEAEKGAREKGVPVLKDITCSCCDKPQTKINAFLDIEGTSDPKYMRRLGVDTDGIIYAKPGLPSTAVDITDSLLRNPEIGLIIFDSVGSMGADAEVEKAIVDINMNQNALFLNRAMRKWQMSLNANSQEDAKSATTIIVVNQSYTTLGNYATEVAQGGRGLRHGKGTSMKTRIKEKIYRNPQARDEVIGVHVVVENMKNKTGMPYRKGEYFLNLDPKNSDMGYCEVDIPLQVMELGVDFGIVKQTGAWIEFKGQKWNGKAKFLEDLRNDPQGQEEIKKAIYDEIFAE